MKRKNLWVQLAALGALGAFGSITVQAADPGKINWSKVPAVKVGLFYPGQSSYEWLISKDHDGASKVKRGDQMAQAYKIQGVPALAVDGKFMVGGKDFAEQLAIADKLIVKARSEKSGKK